MKLIAISEKEALVIVRNLRGAYIPKQDEEEVFQIITRLEKELEVG